MAGKQDPTSSAPLSSLRPPVDRKTAALERWARAQEMADHAKQMTQLSNVELRADLDPWLKDDPIARLGYRASGGMENVNYLPSARGAGRLQRDLSLGYVTDDTRYGYGGALSQMRPDSWWDALQDVQDAGVAPSDITLIPEDTVLMNSFDNSLPAYAHEFRHVGLERLPEFSGLNRATNEALVEMADNPSDSWTASVSGRSFGRTMAPTIEYLNESNPALRTRIRDYFGDMRVRADEAATAQLRAAGEPPRAVRRPPPEPGFFEWLFGSKGR